MIPGGSHRQETRTDFSDPEGEVFNVVEDG